MNPVEDGTLITDGEDPVDDAELADPSEPIEYEPLAAAHAHAGTAEEGAAAEAASLAAVAAAEEPVAVCAQTLRCGMHAARNVLRYANRRNRGDSAESDVPGNRGSQSS